MKNRRLTLGIAAALLVALLPGCGSARSLEAYCATLEEHKDRYLSAMSEATAAMEMNSLEGLVGGMAQAVTAMGDLRIMWAEIAEVAPEEIAADVEAVAESWEQQEEMAKEILDNPLGALVGGITNSMMSAGSIQRVNDYTAANCPGVEGMFYN